MSFLPIVSRELRVTSRRPGTYWTRLTAALAAIVVASLTWMILMRASPRETGFFLFMWLAIIAYVYCFLMGFVITADSLSEEKREGTLGLLFLTDLKGYDVVLGKLVATSISALYGLLAIFPVLGLPLLMGGVAPAEFARVMLVCADVLFLSVAVGILASSLCSDERKSMILAFIALFTLTALLPALGAWVMAKRHLVNPPPWLMLPSPGFAAFAAFDEPNRMLARAKYDHFYESILTIHALAWAALLLACYIVPRSWRDKPRSAAQIRHRAAWQGWAYGPRPVRDAFRRQLLAINPFYWLAARDRFKVTLVWLMLLAVAIIWLVGLVKWPTDFRDAPVYVMTAVVLHSLLKIWIAMESSRRFGADRRSGALELLLSTPLSVPEILRGQMRALARQFGWAIALVFFVDLLFLGAILQRFPNDRESIIIWSAGMAVFLIDCLALGWVGMWLGLTSRKSSQAGTNALVRICVFPWLMLFGLVAGLAILDVMRIFSPRHLETGFFTGAWFLFSAATALYFGRSAYTRLHREFRILATQRVESRAVAWGRWLGKKAAQLRG